MHQGRGGMGMHKHGVSGRPGRNAKFKAITAREAADEQAARDRRRKAMRLTGTTVRDLLKGK